MKSIHIRAIPEPILERLKQRARRHHRSLQGELHHVLAEAAQIPLPDNDRLEIKTVRTQGLKSWSRDAIYED